MFCLAGEENKLVRAFRNMTFIRISAKSGLKNKCTNNNSIYDEGAHRQKEEKVTPAFDF